MNRLLGDAPAAEKAIDHRLALTALLVRCAKVDDVYDLTEKTRIDQILARRYGLDEDAAAEMRAEGEALEADAGDTVHLTRVVKEAVPYEDRTAVVEALWMVAFADDDRDYTENAFLRLAVKLLGVNDVDGALARQRAEAAHGSGVD